MYIIFVCNLLLGVLLDAAMKIESERLLLYPISEKEMEQLIENEENLDLKQAYSEMLQGCLQEPEKRMAMFYQSVDF